jgi:hypothetical protein
MVDEPVAAGAERGRGQARAGAVPRLGIRLTDRADGSWADRLNSRLAAGPVPPLVWFAVAGLAIFAALSAAQWVAGASSFPTVHLGHVVFAGFTAGAVWLVGVFNRSAAGAIAGARELVRDGPVRAAELEREFVRTSPILTLLFGVAAVMSIGLRFIGNPGLAAQVGFSGAMPALLVEALALPLLAFSAGAYSLKLIDLAWQIHHVTTHELRVDAWNVRPLFAFSTVTLELAASTIAAAVLVYVGVPALLSDTAGLVGLVAVLAMAVIVFVLPLIGVHGELVKAKYSIETALSRETERTIAELQVAIASSDAPSIDHPNRALSALEIAQRAVDRVPVWPWSVETVRWLVGALLFPIVLYVAQYVLKNVLP